MEGIALIRRLKEQIDGYVSVIDKKWWKDLQILRL
jgi:hypothetical protein